MADEARLNELLDLVEQARTEGDKATEAKATEAYKRESAPAAPFPDIYGGAGGFNPMLPRIAGAAEAFTKPLGLTGENTASPIKNALGPLETLAQAGSGTAGTVAGGFAGMGQGVKNLLFPDPTNMDPGDRTRQVQEAMTYQPRTGAGAGMSRVANAPGEVWQAGTNKAGEVVADVTGSPLLGALIKTAGDVAPGVATARLTAGPRGPRQTGDYVSTKDAVPSTGELKSAANAAYRQADAAGVVIKPESTARVITIFEDVAKKENLGKLPTKLKEAVDILNERVAKKEPLTLMDADKVRQLIGDAFKSTDAADRRLAKLVQRGYDDYLANLTPEDTLAGNAPQGVALLNQARGYFSRTKNSEMLDRMEEKAATKAETNYSQAGLEHALRREFEKLANNDKKSRYLSPEQKAAVKKVAAPGPMANLLRAVGKFDPAKGGMGATMGGVVGGGTGAAIGGVLAGPMGAGGGALLGQAALGTAANLANRAALRGTKSRVTAAREALVGKGLTNDGLLAKGRTKPLVAAPQGLLGSAAARPTAQIRRDIQVLDAEVARLADAGPAGATVRASVESELARLQQELAAAVARGESP